MYFQKYLKYKTKYLELKNNLIGGDCDPVPMPTGTELLTQENYESRKPNQRITIGGH